MKIIDLQVLADDTIREDDLTQSFADDWWDSHCNLTTDFIDKYFFDGQNHKKEQEKESETILMPSMRVYGKRV